MTIRKLVLKPIHLLIHAANKQSEAPRGEAPRAEWLDDHEFSFDAIGRGLNGLPPRPLSERDEHHD